MQRASLFESFHQQSEEGNCWKCREEVHKGRMCLLKRVFEFDQPALFLHLGEVKNKNEFHNPALILVVKVERLSA